jgi:alkylation response protein AidB-like acyl-CoA dehydrogenase
MDFGLTDEQAMIVDTTRAFVETELYPHEAAVERSGHLDMDLVRDLQKKAMSAGTRTDAIRNGTPSASGL